MVKHNGKADEIKSSFPGLWRYSASREVPFVDAYEWLEAKRKDDDIGNFWRVYDKLYNLEEFIDKHPGGRDWIEVSRGTDITEAFVSSHLVNVKNVEAILEKYFVQPATSPRNSPYSFHDDGFYKTLKRRIEPVLKKVGTGPTDTAVYIQDTLAILCLLVGTIGASLESVALLVVAGILLDMCMTSAHNFFHIRDNLRKYYFDLSLMSSFDWRISHGLSHHMYPNTLLDLEITVAEPLLPFLPKRTKNWVQRYASVVYTHLIYFGGFYPAFIKRTWMSVVRRKYPIRPENSLPFIELAIFAAFAPSFWSACKSWLLFHSVCSYAFIYVGLVAGHHHTACFHDGDEARPDPDFGLCQLDATKEKVEDIFAGNLLLALTTFSDHPLHHLFPCVCHSKLHYIKPIMEATLKEFEEEYQKLTQLQLVVGLNKQYARNKANSFPRKKTTTTASLKNTTVTTTSIGVPQG